MDLYLDDCSDANRLVRALTDAGHRVETPRSAGTSGFRDPEHLSYAARNGLTMITKNPSDFVDLHLEWQAQGRTHCGIWLIYQDNVKGKDMEPSDIVRSIEKLLAAGIPIPNELHILNHWR
jgi:predicted nuclease of predicted toxin-antitoxin system